MSFICDNLAVHVKRRPQTIHVDVDQIPLASCWFVTKFYHYDGVMVAPLENYRRC